MRLRFGSKETRRFLFIPCLRPKSPPRAMGKMSVRRAEQRMRDDRLYPMKQFYCECGNTLFFENTLCLRCGRAVGFDLAQNRMRPITEMFPRCRNGTDFGACNWIMPSPSAYCLSCRLNRTVPNLSGTHNLEAWRRMERAKRRVVYTLAQLGIAPLSKAEDFKGVAFDFLTPASDLRVITGHQAGVITVNTLEADDYYRERERHLLGEPYRTLVGHFRHEMGHYYWDRFFLGLANGDARLTELRAIFGDERDDYASALARHYANGPVGTWPSTHITGYAAAHPWEDWAETWAHYLHIVDAMETTKAFEWKVPDDPLAYALDASAEPFDETNSDAGFLKTLNGWAALSPALNEIAASLGHMNLYPFVLSPSAVTKIHFVHKMVTLAAATWPHPTMTPTLSRGRLEEIAA